MTATITPLAMSRRTHAQPPPTIIAPPRAALSLRTLSKRIVVWAAVCDADPEPMHGHVELAETGGSDAPASAFVAALPAIMDQVRPWLARLAAPSTHKVTELAVPNPSLRARLREGEPIEGVMILPASEVSGTDPVVAAASDIAERLHREVISPDETGTVQLAVAASLRAHHRGAGIAWTRADGLYETQIADTSDQTAALVRAIAMAVRAHRRHLGTVVISCESRAAVELARAALERKPTTGHPARASAQRALSYLEIAGDVRVVSRTAPDALRSGATRLAQLTRRDAEFDITGPEHEKRAAAALADELAGAEVSA
ncbi:hypothetical protein [Cellulosimicrobium sp. Marseille-Q4280]|uniref:hypothetical protein n=1 Tax=Cellulosimicrobium sp. Marseille-Q4280 TaxID=2937992 RepID=UPI002041A176|nr:hypothetical protein [Cellulosimicrobium sp. Marseille-Q4280]